MTSQILYMKFGEYIKLLRERNQLVQRQLASYLDMDTAMLSKIERGERRAKKEQIPEFAKQLNVNASELNIIWVADQVYDLIKNEVNASDILNVVAKKIIV